MDQQSNTSPHLTRTFFNTENLPLSPISRKPSVESLSSPLTPQRKLIRVSSIKISPSKNPSTGQSLSSRDPRATSQRRFFQQPVQNDIDNVISELDMDPSRPGSRAKSMKSTFNLQKRSPSNNTLFNNTKSTWRTFSPSNTQRLASFSKTCGSGFKCYSRESTIHMSPDLTRRRTAAGQARIKIKGIIDECDKMQTQFGSLERSIEEARVTSRRESSPQAIVVKDGKEEKPFLKFDFWKNNENFAEARAKLKSEVEKCRMEEVRKQHLREFFQSKAGTENENKSRKKKEKVVVKAEDIEEANDMVKFVLQEPRIFNYKRVPVTRSSERLIIQPKTEVQEDQSPRAELERSLMKLRERAGTLNLEKSLMKLKERAATIQLVESRNSSPINLKSVIMEKKDTPSLELRSITPKILAGTVETERTTIFKGSEGDRMRMTGGVKRDTGSESRRTGFGFRGRSTESVEKDFVMPKRTASMILNETVVNVQKKLDAPKASLDDLFMLHKKGKLRKTLSIQKMYRASSRVKDNL